MKVKLFSHSDLDGIGCGIIGKLAFPEIDIEYCDYDNVNGKIAEYLVTEGYKNYDLTYITDISVNEEVAEMINNLDMDNEFVLLDHHKTALWLNKYRWTDVRENLSIEMKHSGTAMLYYNVFDFYVNEFTPSYNTLMDASNFVEMVRRYDTWEFKTVYNDQNPKMLNDLMYLKGRDKFITDVIYQIKEFNDFSFRRDDLELLKINQEKIDKYIESKDKTLIVKNVLGHHAGVVFAEQYHSELGNTLAELHPEVDFIMIINPSQSVSYHTVKDINLSVIAGKYKGGGHPKASGSPMSIEVQDKIIQVVIETNSCICNG